MLIGRAKSISIQSPDILYTSDVVQSLGAQKSRTLALLSTEAEYISQMHAAKEALWLQSFVSTLPSPTYPSGLRGQSEDSLSCLRFVQA